MLTKEGIMIKKIPKKIWDFISWVIDWIIIIGYDSGVDLE